MTTLYVKVDTLVGYDYPNSALQWQLRYDAVDGAYDPGPAYFVFNQGTLNPTATPPTFPDTASARAYFDPLGGQAILDSINTLYGFTLFSAYDVEALDSAVKAKFDGLATVANSGSYNDLSNKPSLSGTRTQSALSLSLVGTGATGTQIDATHDALISMTVSTSATATIAGAATSAVALKICATNSSTEANWTTVQTSETSQSYSLAVALQGVTGGKGCLTSLVPAGWYAKLVNSGSGTHSEAVVSGQKVIFS